MFCTVETLHVHVTLHAIISHPVDVTEVVSPCVLDHCNLLHAGGHREVAHLNQPLPGDRSCGVQPHVIALARTFVCMRGVMQWKGVRVSVVFS